MPSTLKDYYIKGDWNAQCYECGRKMKASHLRRHWQGYYVCPEHWEPRHDQDFVKATYDNQTVPWAQPEPANVFVNLTISTPFQTPDVGSSVITTESIIPITTESGNTFITNTGIPGTPGGIT